MLAVVGMARLWMLRKAVLARGKFHLQWLLRQHWERQGQGVAEGADSEHSFVIAGWAALKPRLMPLEVGAHCQKALRDSAAIVRSVIEQIQPLVGAEACHCDSNSLVEAAGHPHSSPPHKMMKQGQDMRKFRWVSDSKR